MSLGGSIMAQAHSVLDRRRAGVLLHITSLPGGFGNGDLGADAYRFVDFLVSCGVSVWQTLPINPTHQDGSPYQCLSAKAGNPLLINLQWLVNKGWLNSEDLESSGELSPAATRLQCLARAYEIFGLRATIETKIAYERFCDQHRDWLFDYALFIALREQFDSMAWQCWPESLRDRNDVAIKEATIRLHDSLERVKFEQFVFFTQWQELRAYANSKGILMFGDIPIFVAGDSADVWAKQAEFDLDEAGEARVVAGVPPDYFSETGQRWGNPHYRWDRMESDGFSWWIERFRGQLALFDWVRIDHFRGLEAYWEIPASSETAIEGRWVKAPGEALLENLFEAIDGSGLPLVAEDLGIITPEVDALRKKFDIPGMLILQFAFDGGGGNPYLPQNHEENSVVYTGTHDNDTSLSWFEGLSEEQKEQVYRLLGHPSKSMPSALIDCAMASVARLSVIPMQDVLHLGGEDRMNTPGTTEGNWSWRFSWDQVGNEVVNELLGAISISGRLSRH